MSELYAVLAEHLAAAHCDDRLTQNERSLLEAVFVALDAFGQGKDLWSYCRETDERLAKEEEEAASGSEVAAGKAKEAWFGWQGRALVHQHGRCVQSVELLSVPRLLRIGSCGLHRNGCGWRDTDARCRLRLTHASDYAATDAHPANDGLPDAN